MLRGLQRHSRSPPVGGASHLPTGAGTYWESRFSATKFHDNLPYHSRPDARRASNSGPPWSQTASAKQVGRHAGRRARSPGEIENYFPKLLANSECGVIIHDV